MNLQLSIQKIYMVSHVAIFSTIVLISPSIPSLNASATSTSSSCRPVKALAKQLVKKGSKASLSVTESPASKYWRDAPQGIYLDLVAKYSSFSDRSMLSDAQKIISQCPGVVGVRFSDYGSDWGPAYGLVNRKVRIFGCPNGMGPENRPFKWGSECNA